MRVTVLNVGSGTVKAALVEVSGAEAQVRRREVAEWGAPGSLDDALGSVLDATTPEGIDAVAHRIVHGGVEFTRPTPIDDAVEEALEALTPLAPLHNPPALYGVRLARRRLPEVPAVAVFDTTFHAERSEVSRLYALPRDLAHRLGLYRYGFHGIAHASLVGSLATATGCEPQTIDAVTLQLGSGCSACAVANGRSVETSMGFTPLEGLPMATRSGDVDPGVVFQLVRSGQSVDEVEALLNHRSGLLGLSGSADVREILRAESSGDSRAALALELFVRRIVATVGAYLTLLEGRGSLVFGGGIGANSAEVRRRVAAGLGAWNVALDPERNLAGEPGPISKPGTRPVYVLETEEEPLIAREAASVLDRPRGDAP
jgi:acetate kinase